MGGQPSSLARASPLFLVARASGCASRLRLYDGWADWQRRGLASRRAKANFGSPTPTAWTRSTRVSEGDHDLVDGLWLHVSRRTSKTRRLEGRATCNPASWLFKRKDFQARSRRRFFAVRAGRTRTPLWWPSVRVSAPPQAKVWCKTTHEVPRTRSWSFARRRTAHPLSPGRRNYGGGYSLRRRRD